MSGEKEPNMSELHVALTVCRMLGITVVSERENLEIKVFSKKHNKYTIINQVSYLTYEQLIQICGEEVKQCVNRNDHVDVPGTVRMKTVRESIAVVAGHLRDDGASNDDEPWFGDSDDSDSDHPENNFSNQETGAVRGTDLDECRLDLIPAEALRAWGRAFGEGAKKYGLHNWLKGFKISGLICHAQEHLLSFLDGDKTEDHLGHAIWNIGAAIHFAKHRPDLMDLPPYRQFENRINHDDPVDCAVCDYDPCGDNERNEKPFDIDNRKSPVIISTHSDFKMLRDSMRLSGKVASEVQVSVFDYEETDRCKKRVVSLVDECIRDKGMCIVMADSGSHERIINAIRKLSIHRDIIKIELAENIIGDLS